MPKLGVNAAELQDAWDEIRSSGFFSEGKYVRLFEEEVQKWSGLHAVAVCNAGAGLFSLYRLLTPGRGAVAAVPNNTFFATGAMAIEAGLKVALLDCSRHDFCVSYVNVVESNAEVIVLTHVGGALASDYALIAEYCKRKNKVLIEDAAHAFGVGKAGQTAGSLSHAAVFSLYPTKAVPAGEGGVIVTKSDYLAEQLRVFRNYGKRTENGVISYSRGFNFRMDEWTAAVAYLQMKRLPEIMEKRHQAAFQLESVIAPMVHRQPGATNWYKYIVRADEARGLGISRFSGKVYQRSDQLRAALKIEPTAALSNSEWAADQHACLPIDEDLYLGMSTGDIWRYLRGE